MTALRFENRFYSVFYQDPSPRTHETQASYCVQDRPVLPLHAMILEG